MKVLRVVPLVALLLGSHFAAAQAAPAALNSASDVIKVYSPITDCDASHTDKSSWWSKYNPTTHHRVYKYATPAGSFLADISMDIYARASGKCVVTIFGSRTAGGDTVVTKVLDVRNGCASGAYADGGKVVFLAAVNKRTGKTIGKGSIMHVASTQVTKGQTLTKWTVIGKTARFRETSCYGVTTTEGIHTHVEWINMVKYACFVRFPYKASLGETTVIGKIGVNKTGIRQTC